MSVSGDVQDLIFVGILVAGFIAYEAIKAWKKIQLAKHGYREGRDGNIHKL